MSESEELSANFLTGEEGSSSTFGAGGRSDDSGVQPDSDETFIDWIVRQRGYEFLVKVDHSFLYDEFNLNGLKPSEAKEFDLDSGISKIKEET